MSAVNQSQGSVMVGGYISTSADGDLVQLNLPFCPEGFLVHSTEVFFFLQVTTIEWRQT